MHATHTGDARAQVAEGARLQVAHERWRAGPEGQAQAAQRRSLPVHMMEPSLRLEMGRTRVAVVCGETGSGKSTQVPQMAAS